MKKLSIFLLAIVAILSLSACSEDDDFTFVPKPSPEGVMFLNTPAPQYSLTASNGDNIAERFVWNEVEFDVQTTVRYELQGSTTEAFDIVTILGSDIAETNYAVTVKSMLELAKEAGLDNDPETEEAPNTGMLYFKVRAYVGDSAPSNVEELSEVLGLTVVLPESEGAEPAKTELYLVGDVTAAGWSTNNNNTPLFRDAENENLFYFTGRFNGSADTEGFKLLEMLGDNTWQPQWGLENGELSSSEILGKDPSAFPVDADGYYTLSVNIDELTYSFDSYDASGATTYATIGLIGDSTPEGWDADQDMTQSEFDPHIWYIKGIELTDGEAKFRADNDWVIDWGGNTALSGVAPEKGPNIPVTSGVYDVWFNDLTGRYVFIPQVQE